MMKANKILSYSAPSFAVLNIDCQHVLCESGAGSTINDLTEDDKTLGGLFEN